MEKKIVTISALCFLMVGVTAALGILIEDEMLRRVAVIAGCLVVIWLTTLNFKCLKLMKMQFGGVAAEVPDLVHWLQGETWPEILSREKVQGQFREELEKFLVSYLDCDAGSIKGYRIWRTEDTEKYFDWNGPAQQQILVLMDESGQHFQVFGSEALQKAMEEHVK
jgi:hypothetical protein